MLVCMQLNFRIRLIIVRKGHEKKLGKQEVICFFSDGGYREKAEGLFLIISLKDQRYNLNIAPILLA